MPRLLDLAAAVRAATWEKDVPSTRGLTVGRRAEDAMGAATKEARAVQAT
jgi:hypothetical protein